LRALIFSFDSRFRTWLAGRATASQWTLLLILSLAFGAVLDQTGLPAALLLGPMVAAILLAASEARVRVPQPPFQLAQGVIGCLIAHNLPVSILAEMRSDWPLFIGTVFAVIAVSVLLGWLLSRWGVLPGTSAVWGSSPGGASAMMLMAEAYGADVRLVAFMLYLRVMLVAVVASLVSRLWVIGSGGAPPPVDWWGAVAWLSFGATLAVIVAGVMLGRWLKIPAGPLLVPLVIAAVLANSGYLTITLPPWFLAVSYGLIGWSIGLRFTRGILVHAARALPRVALSILTLMAICGGLAVMLVVFAGIDPLSAYLATSPGGADSVAIIAASSHVNLPFVMAMQACRVFIIIVTGPSLMRFFANRIGAAEAARAQPTPSALSEP
jgi:membrane AbrB-like protein